MSSAHDTNTLLARLLHAEERVELGVLQRLLADARAPGGGALGQALVRRGLITPSELADFDSRVRDLIETAEQVHPEVVDGERRIGDYRLLDKLGAGGMGSVYLGEHVRSGARHAVKMLRLGGNPEMAERFQRECQAQAKVDDHPNVVRVHAAGREDRTLYLVMDLADGGDLSDLLEDGPLDPGRAAEIVAALARGLEHVHACGVLHRDLKPANILFHRQVPKLVDFGIARLVGEATLTVSGALLGTPCYMAPEQASGKTHEIDQRTDVYGLGAVLYHALTGRPPFEGPPLAVLVKVAHHDPPPPSSQQDVPRELEQVCLRALAKRPDDRFQSAADLAAALEQPGAVPLPDPRARTARVLAAIAAVLALVVVALVFFQAEPDPPAGPTVAELQEESDALADASWQALCADRPVQEDAGLPDEWRSRSRELREGLADDAPPSLNRVEQNTLGLEVLLALDGDDVVAARSALGRLEDLATDPTLTRTLRAAIASVTGSGDPRQALADLEAGIASGLARPELRRWRELAVARRGLLDLREGRPKEVHVGLKSLDPRSIPPALKEQIVTQARANARNRVAALLRLPLGTLASSTDVTLLIHLLRAVHHIKPRAPLTPAIFEDLRRLALDPNRHIISLAPALAALVPDRFEIQSEVARHAEVVNLRRRSSSRKVGALYIPPTRRAFELAKGDQDRITLGILLCKRLFQGRRYSEVVPTADQVLALPGLEGRKLAEAFFWRGYARSVLKQYLPAVADLDLAIKTFPEFPIAYFQRGWAKVKLQQYRGAIQDGLRYVRDIDPILGSLHKRNYPLAVLVVWTSCQRLKLRDERTEAVEMLLKYYKEPEYAGWWIRLAWMKFRDDRAMTEHCLLEALKRLPKCPALRDMEASTRNALAVLRRSGKRARRTVWKLCNRVEKRRPPEKPLP